MNREEILARLRMETGPFTAWVAGSPKWFAVILFGLGFVAGALLV